jgi:ribonuclease I
MQSWIIFTLLIVSVLSFDWSSLALFPTPPPKNYPQRELEKSALEQIHHNRERKKDPPRIKSDVNCPDMGFAKYDHLMLVQYWPTTLCFLSVGQGSFCKVRHTKHEFNETYLIHGMWPINLNRRVRGKLFPQCCNNSITFNWDRDMVAHKEVQEMSDKYWPELLVPPEQLETHTKKHGIWR